MNTENFNPINWDYQNMAYGPDASQKLDIVIPQEKSAHAVVYIHGGAFMIGNKMEYPSFLAGYVEKNIVASIDYRLVLEPVLQQHLCLDMPGLNTNNCIHMNDILSDIDNALKKITETAQAKGVAVKSFILTGHSAGGHIALLYGYKFPQKIGACVSMAGPTDFTDDLGWSSMTMWGEDLESRLQFLSGLGSRLAGCPIQLTRADWTKQKDYPAFKRSVEEISPIAYVSQAGNIPPTLLVHARSDDQVPYSNAIRLKTALGHASVPHKLLTPAGSGNSHMLGGEIYADNTPIFFHNQTWVSEAQKWLEPYLQ